MKRVILLFVSLAVMAFQLLFAQSFTVKGKVIALYFFFAFFCV